MATIRQWTEIELRLAPDIALSAAIPLSWFYSNLSNILFAGGRKAFHTLLVKVGQRLEVGYALFGEVKHCGIRKKLHVRAILQPFLEFICWSCHFVELIG